MQAVIIVVAIAIIIIRDGQRCDKWTLKRMKSELSRRKVKVK